MRIVITGSVCTGKTTIAKALAKKLRFGYLNVNELIKNNNLYSSYNKRFDSYEVDVKKLNRFLIKFIKNKKSIILDSHLSHYLPKKYVDLCIVCKCDLKELKKRLEKREYNKIKIRENLDAEIFDTCLIEAVENKHKVIVVGTTNKKINENIKEIIKKIR